MSQQNCKKTVTACFIGYVVQAIVNTLTPLLFVTFSDSYGIPMTKITLLVTVNFLLQLCIDMVAARFASRISYRVMAVAAQLFGGAGLILLSVLPDLLPDPFVGLMLAVVVCAVGGGLLEVIVSPMVESCPLPNKQQMMSLLHSVFCWGQVAVIGLSTLADSCAPLGNRSVCQCNLFPDRSDLPPVGGRGERRVSARTVP